MTETAQYTPEEQQHLLTGRQATSVAAGGLQCLTFFGIPLAVELSPDWFSGHDGLPPIGLSDLARRDHLDGYAPRPSARRSATPRAIRLSALRASA